MTRAKPAYDIDGEWKFRRRFTPEEWDELVDRLQQKLRPFYPVKTTPAESPFGHPADAWSSQLLTEARSAVWTVLGTALRLTNEELRAERLDLLCTLRKAARKLGTVSLDLNILFGVDTDLLGTRDSIKKIIHPIRTSLTQIALLPTAVKQKNAESAAAQEMAVRCLRVFKGSGGKVLATADKDRDQFSDAIKILKILGDGLGISLSEVTWKKHISRARRVAPDLR